MQLMNRDGLVASQLMNRDGLVASQGYGGAYDDYYGYTWGEQAGGHPRIRQ